MKRRGRLMVLGIALVLIAGLAVIFRPTPIPVETVSIHRAELQEVVEEEGKTRMHDHFTVAATVAGKLRRITLHAGDQVHAGETLAWIDPAPIDPRQKAGLEARLNASRANQQQAEALAGKAKADYAQTQQDLARGRALFAQGIISREAFEKAMTLNEAAEKQLQAAQSALESASYQVEEARSALLLYNSGPSDLPTAMLSPVDGHVLRLIEQSERVVAIGTPLLEIGYTPRLEIVADFLTRDAVRIRPGMSAMITDWGGDREIPARVRIVEPGGFTKISALGVEEQRVNVICDPIGPTDSLQDGYRANVRVIVWQGKDVLQVPSSAVFRSSGDWAVFVVRDGKARKAIVKIGHHGETNWGVLAGLRSGDRVIVHPSAEIDDGVRVKATAS